MARRDYIIAPVSTLDADSINNAIVQINGAYSSIADTISRLEGSASSVASSKSRIRTLQVSRVHTVASASAVNVNRAIGELNTILVNIVNLLNQVVNRLGT